jgi:hypothetical protein
VPCSADSCVCLFYAFLCVCGAGTVAPLERGRRASAFNTDPDVHVMLLTTAVGGLGLTLTAADVVVFLDHDWNPMRDLQVGKGPGGGSVPAVLRVTWHLCLCAHGTRALACVHMDGCDSCNHTSLCVRRGGGFDLQVCAWV